MKITVKEFLEKNDIELEELQYFGDACIGAEDLKLETELKVQVNDGILCVVRSDNQWNDPVDVIYGKTENWNI